MEMSRQYADFMSKRLSNSVDSKQPTIFRHAYYFSKIIIMWLCNGNAQMLRLGNARRRLKNDLISLNPDEAFRVSNIDYIFSDSVADINRSLLSVSQTRTRV